MWLPPISQLVRTLLAASMLAACSGRTSPVSTDSAASSALPAVPAEVRIEAVRVLGHLVAEPHDRGFDERIEALGRAERTWLVGQARGRIEASAGGSDEERAQLADEVVQTVETLLVALLLAPDPPPSSMAYHYPAPAMRILDDATHRAAARSLGVIEDIEALRSSVAHPRNDDAAAASARLWLVNDIAVQVISIQRLRLVALVDAAGRMPSEDVLSLVQQPEVLGWFMLEPDVANAEPSP